MKNFVFNQPPGLNNPSNFLFLFQGNFYPENYPRNYPEKHPQNYPRNDIKRRIIPTKNDLKTLCFIPGNNIQTIDYDKYNKNKSG